MARIIPKVDLSSIANGGERIIAMEITLRQIKSLGGSGAVCENPLKAIDEHNYVTITIPKRAAQRKIAIEKAGKKTRDF